MVVGCPKKAPAAAFAIVDLPTNRRLDVLDPAGEEPIHDRRQHLSGVLLLGIEQLAQCGAQVLEHLVRGLVPRGPRLGERLVEHGRHDVGNVVAILRDILATTEADLREDLGVGFAAIEASAGEQLPQDHTHRVDVAATVDGFAPCLLGRHVGELASKLPGECVAALARSFHDAEVDDLDPPVHRDEQIVR